MTTIEEHALLTILQQILRRITDKVAPAGDPMIVAMQISMALSLINAKIDQMHAEADQFQREMEAHARRVH